MKPTNRLSRAEANLLALSKNKYPGRGIVQGVSSDGKHVVQIYWLMGRSENSRNRILKAGEGGRIYTEFADPSKGGDPKLVIYNAMLESAPDDALFVTNGDHTDMIDLWFRELNENKRFMSLDRILQGQRAEPDSPNNTPRIAAMYRMVGGMNHLFEMLVIRNSGEEGDEDGREVVYHYHEREVLDGHDNGIGWCIHTYEGNGNPLPPFQGAPFVVPIGSNIEQVAQTYWDALNEEHRVALVVKMNPLEGGKSVVKIINRHQVA